MDPYHDALQRLRQAVLDGPGKLDPAVRKACAAGSDVPEPLAAYVDMIHRHAYRIADEDVAALLPAGYSQDQVFEATVSAALGAGLARLEAGLRSLDGGA